MVYEIREKKALKNVNDDLVALLKTRFKNKSGIIYCVTRKDCERLAEILLKTYSIKCNYYHADMPYTKR